MNRLGTWVIAGLVAAGALACQKEDPATKEALKKIDDRLASIEKKIDTMPAGRGGPANPMAAGPRPGSPDPASVYSVPIDADDAIKGPANAPITIVEIAEFA
jgi:hypothetical protein